MSDDCILKVLSKRGKAALRDGWVILWGFGVRGGPGGVTVFFTEKKL